MRCRLCQSWFVIFSLALLTCAAASPFATAQSTPTIPPIKRVLPPEGLFVPKDFETRLYAELRKCYERVLAIPNRKKHAADVLVFLKAVEYAIEMREFYDQKDFKKADDLLAEANRRISSLEKEERPWTHSPGITVRGYQSLIDGSAQPYGLVIPKNHRIEGGALYVWLHGRGDKQTDLHFIHERMSKAGQITPPNALVVHAFGRQCVGYKNAAEEDIFELIEHVCQEYTLDRQRIVLIGFSMGGAGAWHVGAHHGGVFKVVAPGAGFAETAQYNKLKPEDYPTWYEQKLWGLNDTPAYVRNLFNTTVIAYSGELDRQIQAARVMEGAYQAEGRTLTHLIGPKTEHKYEPKTLEQLLQKIQDAIPPTTGPSIPAKRVYLQTRTLRYANQEWVTLFRLDEHWQDSRVDASVEGNHYELTTKNVARLGLFVSASAAKPLEIVRIAIDGQELQCDVGDKIVSQFSRECYLQKKEGKWRVVSSYEEPGEIVKTKDLQGPIDDAFCEPFLVVTPSGKSKHARFQAWQEFELSHFRDRWRALMRGDIREKKDVDVTEEDMHRYHLILWGDADSNDFIRAMETKLPIRLSGGAWQVGTEKYEAARHLPVYIYPNPAAPHKYIVLNSGLTFREGHDRTNSLQNPKLPDWAIIDITQNPDASAPGKVVNAGFFDEEWKLKPPPK